MATLFISDLHLEEARPEIGEQFLAFLAGPAREADALYILGDLFEAWIGDDDPSEYYAGMKRAIRALVDSGVPVFFMHGNRDFMIGDRFAAETGVKLLEDPHPIELFGSSVLLSHGDSLCTDDVEYQQVRAMTRNPEWQAMMLTKSVEERLAFAQQARAQSMAHGEALDMELTHVNHDAAHATIRPMGTGPRLFAQDADGGMFPVEISLSPIETEDGTLVASSLRDVTERREAEAARLDAEKKERLSRATSGLRSSQRRRTLAVPNSRFSSSSNGTTSTASPSMVRNPVRAISWSSTMNTVITLGSWAS